jgi:hypothetical protein
MSESATITFASSLRRRRTLAYDTLKITRDSLRAAAPITPQLRMIAKSLKKRNLPVSPYYYLKCSAGVPSRLIVDLYYSLPRDQRDLVPIEGYCASLSIQTNDILETIVRTIATVSRQRSIAIASSAHPLVVEKTVEMALTDEGIEDRTLLHKAVGFLPTPKGTQISVNTSANANAASAANTQVISLPAPPPEATIRRLVDRFNDARAIGPSAPAQLPVAPPSNLPDRMPYETDAAVPLPVTIDANFYAESESESDEDE